MSEIEGWKAIGRRVVRIARQRGWTNPWGTNPWGPRAKPWLLAFGAAGVLVLSHTAPHTVYGAGRSHEHRHHAAFGHVHGPRHHRPGLPFLRLPNAPGAPAAPSLPTAPASDGRSSLSSPATPL